MGEAIILFSSSIIRSLEIILIRSALRVSDSKVSSSMKKLSWVAKRTQRIIRKGSSLKVTSGSRGVQMRRSSISSSPSKGSVSSPKRSALRHTANALMVKSRRFWSSSRVPSSTIGLRESCVYDSLRAPTNSTSISRHLSCAVPKFRKILTWAPRPSFLRKASAIWMPLPTTTTSMSLDGRSRYRSRT